MATRGGSPRTNGTRESGGVRETETQPNRQHQSYQVQTRPPLTISTTCLAIIYSYLHTPEIHTSLVVAKSWTLDETGSELLRHLLREQVKPILYKSNTTTTSATLDDAPVDESLQLDPPPAVTVNPQTSANPPLTPYQSIQRSAFDPIGSIELREKAIADHSLGPFNLSYERLPWRQQSSWIAYSLMRHRIIRLHATSIPPTSSVLGGSRDLLGSSLLIGANEIWGGIHHQVLHVYLDQANEEKTNDSIASTQLEQISGVLQWLQSSSSISSQHPPASASESESLESRLIVLTVIDDKVDLSLDHTSYNPSLSNEPPLTLAFSALKFGPSHIDPARLSYMMAQTTPTDLLFHSIILSTRHQNWCIAFLTRMITDISLAHPAPTNDYLHAFSFIRQFYCYQSAHPTGRTKNDSSLEFIASILDLCATSKEFSFLGTVVVPRPIQFELFYLDLDGTDLVKCMSKCLFPYHSSLFCHLKEVYLFHLTGVFPSVSFGGQKFDQSRVFDQAFARALSAPTDVTNQFPKVSALFIGGDAMHGGCYLDDATLRVMSGSFQFIRQIELFNLHLDDITTLFRSYRSLSHLNISDCSILEDDGEMDSRAQLLATRTLRYQELTWSQLPEAILRQLNLRWRRIRPSIRSSLHLYSVLSLIMFVLLLLTDAGSIWTAWTIFSPDVRWVEWMAFFLVVLYGLPYIFYLVLSGGSHQDTCGQVNKSPGYQILGPGVAISLAYFGPILVQEWKTTLWLSLNTWSWCILLPIVTLYLSYHMCHQFYNSHLRPQSPLTWPMTIYRLHDYLIFTPLKLLLTGISFNWILPRLSTAVWDAVHFDGFSVTQLIYTYVNEFDPSPLYSTIRGFCQLLIPSFTETAIRFFTIYFCLLTLPTMCQMMIKERIRKTRKLGAQIS